MAVGDKQKLVIEILEIILGEQAQTNKQFPWLSNKHKSNDFGSFYPSIIRIFNELGGSKQGLEDKKRSFIKT